MTDGAQTTPGRIGTGTVGVVALTERRYRITGGTGSSSGLRIRVVVAQGRRRAGLFSTGLVAAVVSTLCSNGRVLAIG